MKLKVHCPCCRSELTVDSDSGAVLSCEEEKRKVKDFGDFLIEQENRSAALDEKFKAGQAAAQNRLKEIEKKFKAAQKKPIDHSEPPPRIQWD